jgi:hypothetical protein
MSSIFSAMVSIFFAVSSLFGFSSGATIVQSDISATSTLPQVVTTILTSKPKVVSVPNPVVIQPTINIQEAQGSSTGTSSVAASSTSTSIPVAVDSCAGMASGTACTVMEPQATATGTCQFIGESFTCKPN